MEIAENLGARGVGGQDFLLSANEALVLIKVCGVSHIFRDERIVLTGLRDAIDLYGQDDGNSFGLQIAGEGDDGTGSPAMTIQNDAGGSLLLVRQTGFAIGAEQMQNQIVSIASAAIFEGLDVHGGRIGLSQALRNLDGAVHGVVVPNESTQEADYDGGRRRSANGLGFGRDGWRAGGPCLRAIGAGAQNWKQADKRQSRATKRPQQGALPANQM